MLESLDIEFEKLKSVWKKLMDSSFKKVSRSKKVAPGICEEVKELLEKERWIKVNVLSNPERGRMIFQVRKQINEKIAINRSAKMEESVKQYYRHQIHILKCSKYERSPRRMIRWAFP